MSKSKSKRKSPLVAAAATVEKNQTGGKKKKDGNNKRKHVDERQYKNDDDDDAEERRLTSLLFGGTTNLLDNEDNFTKDNRNQIVVSNNEEEYEESNNKKIIIHGGEGGDNNNNLFELDTQGDVDNSMGLVTATEDDNDEDEEEEEEEEEDQIVPKKKKKKDTDTAAWVDDDDDVHLNLESRNRLKKLKKYRDEDVSNISGVELESRLRTRFQESSTLNVRTDWADVKDNDNDEMEDASAIPILASSTTKLPPEILSVRRCPNANQQDCNNATLKSIHFHPADDTHPLLLTAGLDKTLRFFRVKDEGSEKIHGIQFPKLPITCAQFLGDSGQVAISGKRPFFYTYDMIHGKLDCIPKIMNRKNEKTWEKFIPSSDGNKIAFLGNDGYIVFVDVKSKQYMYDVKINGKVNTVAFSPDNNTIYAGGNDGDIYQFDLRKRRCIERYQSDDGTTITSLSTSNNHLAVGSDSGVMNLYSNYSSGNRTFLKSAMNLQTFVDTSVFNHDGQMLAYASSSEKNALRLMHIPTQTIFSNWPTINTPLKHVTTMDFSPSSKYLAIGNNKGDCLLYKLMHYY